MDLVDDVDDFLHHLPAALYTAAEKIILTLMMVAAGLMLLKTLQCSAITFSAFLMSVTYMRVRTTFSREHPACRKKRQTMGHLLFFVWLKNGKIANRSFSVTVGISCLHVRPACGKQVLLWPVDDKKVNRKGTDRQTRQGEDLPQRGKTFYSTISQKMQ